MRVLVTGAAGFIGFHVARRLLDAGHTVAGFDGMTHYYDPALKDARLALLLARPAFSFHRAMLEDMPVRQDLEVVGFGGIEVPAADLLHDVVSRVHQGVDDGAAAGEGVDLDERRVVEQAVRDDLEVVDLVTDLLELLQEVRLVLVPPRRGEVDLHVSSFPSRGNISTGVDM
jgi:nucleoside-diphosphate-sugar epimerase